MLHGTAVMPSRDGCLIILLYSASAMIVVLGIWKLIELLSQLF